MGARRSFAEMQVHPFVMDMIVRRPVGMGMIVVMMMLVVMPVVMGMIVVMGVLVIMVMGMLVAAVFMTVIMAMNMTVAMVMGVFMGLVVTAAATHRAHHSTSSSLIRISSPPLTCSFSLPHSGQAA